MNKLERALYRSLLRFARNTPNLYVQHRLNPNAEVSWLYFDSNANDNAVLTNLLEWPASIKSNVMPHLLNKSRWITSNRLKDAINAAFRTPVEEEQQNVHVDFAMEALRELQLLAKLTEQTSVVRDESTGLIITCTSIFSESDSQLQFDHFTHYYRILIENDGKAPVQLLNRSWIFCGDGNPPVTLPRWAPGVVGERPLLNAGEGFHYMSSTRIPAKSGYMEGSFQFANAKGELFEVPVGRTALTNRSFFVD